MRLPAKPPASDELFIKFASEPEVFARIAGSVRTLPEEFLRYRAWDKIRRTHPVPEGLTREMWWCALKLHRAAGARFLPLSGVDTRPVWFGTPPEVQARLSSLDRVLGSEHQLFRQSALPADSREEYLIKTLFEESITSSMIEGAVTTRAAARAMLAAGRAPKNKHERMIANNYAAIRHLRETAQAPLTPELLLETHRILTAGTLENPDHEGRFRTDADAPVTLQDDEGTVFFTPPPPAELPARVQAMCDFANAAPEGAGFIHPILRSILLHFWLAYDHPFIDGNGRTARAVFYRGMLHAGYPLVEHISISRAILEHSGAYYRAFLDAETHENDATYFVINQLEMLEKSVEQLREHVAKKRREFADNAHRLAALPMLNRRRSDLLLHAIRHPGESYNGATHAGFHRVNLLTARRDLAELASLGLLLPGPKQGRALTYIAPADLAARLEAAGKKHAAAKRP